MSINSGSWIAFAVLIILSASTVRGTTVHQTISVSPVYNFSNDSKYDATVHKFRERLVSALVNDYACAVVSRSYGIEMGREQALRALQSEGADGALLPAQWVLTPMLTFAERDRLEWRIVLNRISDGDVQMEMISIPIESGCLLVNEHASRAIEKMAQSMDIEPRTESNQRTLREHIGKVAIMPAVRLAATDSSEDMLPFGDLLEAGLQQAGVLTVARDNMLRILDEHAIGNIAGATEMFSGNLGRILGAATILRPVFSAENGATDRLNIHVIETSSVALTGVHEIHLEKGESLLARLSSVIEALLDQPLTPLPRGAIRQESLLLEADYHIALVSEVADNARRVYEAVTEAGVGHATSAYALARNDAGRLRDLLYLVNRRLVFDPPELSSVYDTFRRDAAHEIKMRIRELIRETLAQLSALDASPENEAYYRMRGHYVAGEYERALRLTDDPGYDHPRRATDRARLFFLMEEYERAAAELQELKSRSDYQQWILAKSYFKLEQPYNEMNALLECGFAYDAHDITAARLMELLLIHASPGERLENIRRQRSRWAMARPEYYYFVGRTWQDKKHYERAEAYYRRARRATRPNGINMITGDRFHSELNERLAQLEHRIKDEPFQRASEIQPVPNHLRIYIQPMGEGLDANYLEIIRGNVSWFFGAETSILPTIPMPMNDEIYSESRNQFDAAKLLSMLSRIYRLPSDAYHLVFITREDLCSGRLRWVYSRTNRSIGSLLSDSRFQQYIRADQEFIARAVSRAICGDQDFMWSHLLQESLVEEITGSEKWPNSPYSITYNDGRIRGPLTAPGFHYDHHIARLYSHIDINDFHRSFKTRNSEVYVDPSRHHELHPDERDYAEKIRRILSASHSTGCR